MILQEIFDSFNKEKVTTSEKPDGIEHIVTLKSGDKLVFTAKHQKDTVGGDALLDILFTIEGSYSVDDGNSENTMEAFSYVMGFLKELRDSGYKIFHFMADSDHQKLYRALVRRFAKGMAFKEIDGEEYNNFIVMDKGAKLGYGKFEKYGDKIISLPEPIEMSFELEGVWLSVRSEFDADELVQVLDEINELDSTYFTRIGEDILSDGPIRVKSSEFDKQYLDILEKYFNIVPETGEYMDTYLGDGYWSATGIDVNDDEFEVNSRYNKGNNSWDLYVEDLYSDTKRSLIQKFIEDVNPDVIFINGIESDSNVGGYTVYPEENGEFCVIRNGYTVPVTVEYGEKEFTANLDLGDHSFRLKGIIKDGVILLLSRYHADDYTIEELLSNRGIYNQVKAPLDKLISSFDGDVEFDVDDLGEAFLEVFGADYNF